MKTILIISLLLFAVSCTDEDAKYKKLDVVCAYGRKVTIVNVHTFAGTGGGLKGVNYTCKYLDDHGVIQRVALYEKEIKPCQ